MERIFPTTLSLPVWSRPVVQSLAVRRLSISDVRVNHISSVFNPTRGLLRSWLFEKLQPTLNPVTITPNIMGEAPIDGVEVVGWMQIAAAENAVLQARVNEYNRAGSEILAGSSDPYIPGVRVQDMYYFSEYGRTVSNRGYGRVWTPRGQFTVPNLGKRVGVFRDLIGWGGMSWLGKIQWIATLIKWLRLANTPIRDAIGFYMDNKGNLAPNFFNQLPPRPSLSVTVKQRFSSSAPQNIMENFRNPSDFTEVLGSRSVAIDAGESEVTYTLTSFPYVPPVVAEIQPEDRVETRLDSYEVTR